MNAYNLALHDAIVDDTSVVELSGLDSVDGHLLGNSGAGQEGNRAQVLRCANHCCVCLLDEMGSRVSHKGLVA